MNAQQKIQQITLAQDTKIDQFMQVAQQMFPQFSILPEQCRNLFCNAQRKAKGTGSIKSLGQSMLNDVKAINIIASDVGKQIAKNVQSALSTVGNMGQLALDTLKNMYDNFKIYDACSRRFKNFVQDNLLNSVQNLIQPGGPLADMANVLSGTIKGGGNLLDPFVIIGNKFMNQLTNTLNSQLVQCVTKTAATASLALDTVINIKQINNIQTLSNIKNGNFSQLTKTFKSNKKQLPFIDIQSLPKFNLATVKNLGMSFGNQMILSAFNNNKQSSLKMLNTTLQREAYINKCIQFYENQLKSLNL